MARVIVYTEGNWVGIMRADDTDTGWIEVPDETADRWFAAQDAWQDAVTEILEADK